MYKQHIMFVDILLNKLIQWYAWMVGEVVVGENIGALVGDEERFGLPVSGLWKA